MDFLALCIEATWYRRYPLWWLVAALLWPLGLLFRPIAAIRRWLARKIGKAARLHRPVVVVGNISVGGSGKTPLVISLCKELAKLGLQVGVLAHAYKAPDLSPRAMSSQDTFASAGDEACLIYCRCPNAYVWIGRPRGMALERMLEAQTDIDIVLIDDGLQDYSFQRDLELVLWTESGLGNRLHLPAGPLRESWPPHGAGDSSSSTGKQQVPRLLVRTDGVEDDSWLAAGGASFDQFECLTPGLHGLYKLEELTRHDTCNLVGFETLFGQRCHLFCTVARGWRVTEALVALGVQVSPHYYRDHYPLSLAEIIRTITLLPTESKPEAILLTEKDAIKLFVQTPQTVTTALGIQVWVIAYQVASTATMLERISALAQSEFV